MNFIQKVLRNQTETPDEGRESANCRECPFDCDQFPVRTVGDNMYKKRRFPFTLGDWILGKIHAVIFDEQ